MDTNQDVVIYDEDVKFTQDGKGTWWVSTLKCTITGNGETKYYALRNFRDNLAESDIGFCFDYLFDTTH